MTPARLFYASEKLAQAVDEFAKQSLGKQQTFTVNAESDALLISFHTHVIFRRCRFSVQAFFIT